MNKFIEIELIDMDFAFRMDDDEKRRIDKAIQEAHREQQRIIAKQNEELRVLNRLREGIRQPNRDKHANGDRNNQQQ